MMTLRLSPPSQRCCVQRAWPAAALAALAALATLLSGCAVGPDYSGAPAVAQASIDSPAFRRAAAAPVTNAPPPARWWDAVGDPLLTRLIDDAFAASPTLKTAVARVRSARAQQDVNRAALLPTGSARGTDVRGRIPTGSIAGGGGGSAGAGGGGGSSIPDPIRLDSYSASANASWELDIFGGKRRNIDSSAAAVEAQQAALEDAQVTLANEMVQAYATLREAQNRLALALRTVDVREQALALTQQRRARGTASQGAVESADGSLAQARAEVPGLQLQIDQQLDQIAILAGREPGADDAVLQVPEGQSVALPLPPASVPVGQPADWLRRRPDIRQAERTLAQRNATVGNNVAALFPTVSLLGIIASTAQHPQDLFKTAPIWLLVPSLTWNVFNIPSTRAKIRGAEADFDASVGDYERTVLAALQDANDSLSRFGRTRQALAERAAARDAASRGERLVRQRQAGGTASRLDALDAERQRLQADDQWVQAEASFMQAYGTLQKSLGLGWGAPPPAEKAAPASAR